MPGFESAAQSADASLLWEHKPSSPFGESSGRLIDEFHHLQLGRLCACCGRGSRTPT